MTSKEALDLIFDDLRQFEEHFLNGLTKEDKERYETIKKELKALEIVKKKSEFSFWDFKHCDNVDEYNELYNTRDNRLTQEEFDLLKGVLEE